MNDEIKNRIQTLGESKNSALHFLFEYITIKARNKFFEYFLEFTDYNNNKSVIDIGTTPSLDLEDNFFLHKVKKNQNITCFSNQDCSNLSKNFPNIKKFIIGDARYSYLKDNFFDIVHSNATIEHVGSFENQIKFTKELVRISKKFVFIQTPYRFYPIDFHTLLPFIHWLPKKYHRKILRYFGKKFYSLESNLNLLSVKEIKKICKFLNLKDYKIIRYKLFFMTSNLILLIKK